MVSTRSIIIIDALLSVFPSCAAQDGAAQTKIKTQAKNPASDGPQKPCSLAALFASLLRVFNIHTPFKT
jgi:hypothetical protein